MRCKVHVVTDLTVFEVDKTGGSGLTLVELAPGMELSEIEAKTEARFTLKLERAAA
jgi:3-oxoacid CoA-transferase subunit B